MFHPFRNWAGGGGSPSPDLAEIVTGKSEAQRLEEDIEAKRSIHDFEQLSKKERGEKQS